MTEEKTQHSESCVKRIRVDSSADGLNDLFNGEVEIPRMRYGNKQTLDTLVNEEAYLLARYLRNEKQKWNPRIVDINSLL
jgi:hypothetical protein